MSNDKTQSGYAASALARSTVAALVGFLVIAPAHADAQVLSQGHVDYAAKLVTGDCAA